MLTVALVYAGKSSVDHYSTYSSKMRFEPSSQKLGHMIPQHVYAIRHDHVIDSDTQASATFANTLDEEKNVWK